MNVKFCILAMLCAALRGYAQTPAVFPLSIGDRVPDIIFTNVTNSTVSKVQLSDYKGKIIILDLWGSFCSACIDLFPHVDTLQKKFGNDIQVILVNVRSKKYGDDAAKINKILNRVRVKTGATMAMPAVYDSEEFERYFPARVFPQEVWIGKDGVIKAVTGSHELNSDNVQSLITNGNIQLKYKRDRFDVDIFKPLFINGNGGSGTEIISRSMLTGEIDNINGASTRMMTNDEQTGCSYINQTLMTMVRDAYPVETNYHTNRIVTDDPLKYEQIYCYQLLMPPTTEEKVQEYVRQDLTRYFNIHVKRAIKTMRCLVLTAPRPVQKRKNNNQQAEWDLDVSTLKKFIALQTPGVTVNLLNMYSPIPILDETNSQVPISVDLPFNLTDIPLLEAAFKKIGLQLNEEERELEVAVVTSN